MRSTPRRWQQRWTCRSVRRSATASCSCPAASTAGPTLRSAGSPHAWARRPARAGPGFRCGPGSSQSVPAASSQQSTRPGSIWPATPLPPDRQNRPQTPRDGTPVPPGRSCGPRWQPASPSSPPCSRRNFPRTPDWLRAAPAAPQRPVGRGDLDQRATDSWVSRPPVARVLAVVRARRGWQGQHGAQVETSRSSTKTKAAATTSREQLAQREIRPNLRNLAAAAP